MTAIAIEQYAVSAKTWAITLDRSGGREVDATGRDADDYELQLLAKGWKTALEYRTKNPKAELTEEIRYVRSSMRNAALDLNRRRLLGDRHIYRENCVSHMEDGLCVESPWEEAERVARQYEARQLVDRLKSALTPAEWSLAERLVEHYGSGSEALYDPELDTTPNTLNVRVFRLKAKARSLLVQTSGMESRHSNPRS